MSLMHDIIFKSVMKSKKPYVKGMADYDKRRSGGIPHKHCIDIMISNKPVRESLK